MTNAVNIAQSGSNNVTFRNRIINGACVIDQRNAGASVSNTNVSNFSVDRWNLGGASGCTFTAQQVADAPAGFTYSNKITITAATTANDYGLIRQIIEAFNVLDLGWGTTNAQPITVSFWVKVNNAGTYNAVLRYLGGTATYYYVHPYTLAANTWTYVSFTVSGAPTGAGAFTAGNNTGYMDLDVVTLISSGYTGNTATADTWTSTTSYRTSGVFQLPSTLNATFQYTGVQLEAGTTASPFEYRQYGTELQLCQRYYQIIRSNAPYQFYTLVTYESASTAWGPIPLKVSMRSQPTTLVSGSFSVSYGVQGTYLNDTNQTGAEVAMIGWGGTGSGGTVGYAPYIRSNNNTASYMSFSAEL